MMETKPKYSIVIAGDIMPAYKNLDLFCQGDCNALFGPKIVQLFQDADYSIVNLEGTFTNSNEVQKKKGPVIKAPIRAFSAIRSLGVKACALANNHITDANQKGCLDTLETLNKANIDYVGIGLANKMKTHLSIVLGTNRICIYNVSETFYNRPTKTEIGAHLYDEYLVCNEIKQLKQTHDYLIVLYHGGVEYFQYPTPMAAKRCHRMADCGADIIICQHTHCIGCEEQYNNSYILFGQGNFSFGRHSGKRSVLTSKGIILELNITETGLSINKHLSQIIDNTSLEYIDNPDFSEFDERGVYYKSGGDVSPLLQHFLYNEYAVDFFSVFHGKVDGLYYRLLRRYFPRIYARKVLSYHSADIDYMSSFMDHEGRNEIMFYILKEMQNKRQFSYHE